MVRYERSQVNYLPCALQIILLVLWYTVLPTLPAWLVFLPLIVSGVALAILLVIALIALAVYFTR